MWLARSNFPVSDLVRILSSASSGPSRSTTRFALPYIRITRENNNNNKNINLKKNTPHLSELPRPVGFESLPSFSMNVFCSFNCSSLILSNSFFFPPFFLSLFLSLLKNPQIDDIRALKVPEGLAQTFVFFPDFSRPLSYLFISNRKRANRKL